MKRILAIFLLVVLLPSQFNLTWATHFCGKIKVKDSVTLGKEELSCGMEEVRCCSEDSSTSDIPKFKSEDKEREFWADADSLEFIDWKKAKKIVLPDLKPSGRTISLRLPESMLEEIKLLANKRDVPYQSLMKIFLSERIEKELSA